MQHETTGGDGQLEGGLVVVSESQRVTLHRIVAKLGIMPASRLLDIPRPTLMRVLAGVPVREGTALVVAKRLQRMEEASDG